MLGEYEQALELDEDTLARRRRVLGDDHPDTLRSANNVAIDLSNLSQHGRALELNGDTLARRRRILGDDHPDTRRSARYVAADLHVLGRHDEAERIRREFARSDGGGDDRS